MIGQGGSAAAAQPITSEKPVLLEASRWSRAQPCAASIPKLVSVLKPAGSHGRLFDIRYLWNSGSLL